MSKVSGIFRGWEIDHYTAEHPEKGYKLWIPNGLTFFRDYEGASEPFLSGTSFWQRWRIWRELKRERRRRAENRIKELAAK